MASDDTPIGTLRWRVTLATRRQTAPKDETGILETYEMLQTVRADVQPMRPVTFYLAQQTDTPATHLIRLRWVAALDQTQAVIRTTRQPGGADRTEIFRVRRIKEIGGRKRFVEIEAELEKLE